MITFLAACMAFIAGFFMFSFGGLVIVGAFVTNFFFKAMKYTMRLVEKLIGKEDK